jgi:hypothetical protein
MRKLIGIAALAAGLGAGDALAGQPMPREQALQLMARPGSWLEADGKLLPDGTLQAKDLEFHAPGDTAETEEPAINGTISNLNRAKSTMRVLGYTVVWDAGTTLKDENKKKILSSKLQDGGAVKVQGTLQANGTLKATKIKLASVAPGKKPKEKVFGPVTVTDAKSGHLRVLDTVITLREDATFTLATIAPPN